MKHISKIGMAVMASGMLVVTSCSDFSDYNTVPGSNEASADKTLWENISGNANLSDFAAVLQRVGYDKVLSESHTYTVWAPVNGSFNVDSLNNVSVEKVQKEFVENLIADYAHKETDVNDTTIYMLNEKLLKFANKNTSSLTFDAQNIIPSQNNGSVYNYPSTNGLLYMVSSPSTFRYNAYEIISEMGGKADNFASYVKRYETRLLDENKSVKGEIINGVQHYDDSVVVVSNSLCNRLNAQLTNEDSLYTLLIPNDAAWTKTYNKISKYYNYIPKVAYQDLSSTAVGYTKGGSTSTSSTSIMAATVGSTTYELSSAPVDAEIQEAGPYMTDSITKLKIVQNLMYSETNRRYNSKLTSGGHFVEGDTLCTTSNIYLTDLQDFGDVTEQEVRLSNGHMRLLNDYPFSKETYLPEYRTNSVARCLTSQNSNGSYVYWTISGDLAKAVWTPEYYETSFRYVCTNASTLAFAPELDFYLRGVRSATYDVYVVMVPPLEDGLPSTVKPYSLRVDINYTDANNTQIAGRFDGTEVKTRVADIKRVNPFIVNCMTEDGKPCVDTLHVGRVTFPISYYGLGNVAPNLKVMHTFNTFSSSNRNKYEQNLRIASVILKPVYEEEENATKED